MITDSKNITWTANEDRSLWTSSEGNRLEVNLSATDEQVLSCIESMRADVPQNSDADRIAELEAQVKALLAKLS
jgi:hypothetical protein